MIAGKALNNFCLYVFMQNISSLTDVLSKHSNTANSDVQKPKQIGRL